MLQRVSKDEAEERFNQGINVLFIPENTNPSVSISISSDRLFGLWVNKTVNKHEDGTEYSFKEVVSRYKIWNCRCSKVVFYIV